MKKIKLLMLTAIVTVSLNTIAQDFKANYSTSGGKNEQKELKKVFISDFVVKQILSKNATAKSGGGLSGDPAYAHMTVDFGAVNKDAYQQLVTELYNLTVQKFKSAGYTVITGDEAKAKTQKELKVYPLGKPENTANIGLNIPIRPKDQLFFKTNNIANNNYMKLAKDLDAVAFQFSFQVDYVHYQNSGSTFATKSNLEARPYLALSQVATMAVSKGMGSVTVDPQLAPDDWVGPEGFKKTAGSNVLGTFFGNDNISSTAKFVVDINQEKYLAYVKEYLTLEINNSIDTWIQEATK